MEWTQTVQGQHNAYTWFTASQLPSVIRGGIVPEWFHGIISRKMAEELLMPKPPGYFLIRVSETRIGYTLSYRAEDRCRHFMIDVLADGQYIIVGEDRCHRFLQDLIDFHRRTPVSPFTEVLTVACGQFSNEKTDYAELLFNQRRPNPKASSQQGNTLQMNRSRSDSEDEMIPPNLPHRPQNLISFSFPAPSSQPKKLYPCLNEDTASSLPDIKPVPLTTKTSRADNSPSSQPPQVPARSCPPPLMQNRTCIRTVSAPRCPLTPNASEHPVSSNTQPAKNHEVMSSVASNIKNLKKKFQKKRNMPEEPTYTEINLEASDRRGKTENEYLEIIGGQPFHAKHLVCADTDVMPYDEALPPEYLNPPPFAPGY